MSEQHSAENATPVAHDDEGNLIAVLCGKCGTITAVGFDHECVIPPGGSNA